MHKLLINPVSRFTVFMLGAFVALPWMLDTAAALLHVAQYSEQRDIWHLVGMDVFIILFCLACRHAYEVQDAFEKAPQKSAGAANGATSARPAQVVATHARHA